MHVPMEMLKAVRRLSHDAHPVHRRRAGRAGAARRARWMRWRPGRRPWRSRSRPASCVRWRIGATGRWQSLPEVPSLKSLGAPVQFAQWSALFVPAGTPDDVVAQAARGGTQGRRRPGGGSRRSTAPAARSSISTRPSSRPTGTPMRHDDRSGQEDRQGRVALPNSTAPAGTTTDGVLTRSRVGLSCAYDGLAAA